MNLQLVSPYTKCPFRCPFCVAAINDNSPYSDNFYKGNTMEYLAKLIDIIKVYNIQTVVITGDTEPTLFPDWLELVTSALRQTSVKIEIQTRNYKFKGDRRSYDVVAYSFDKVPEREIKSRAKTTRAVFINNKRLNLDAVINYRKRTNQQVTVKQMQKTAYGIQSIDQYIDSVYNSLSINDVSLLKYNHVRYDENCMDSKNRYVIFRCDGEVYQTWDEPPKK